MAYINYARINAQRSVGKSSAVTKITKDFDSIPWAQLFDIYKEGADDWEELAKITHRANEDEKYEYLISQKEVAWSEMNSESGAYEGNLRDEFPKPAYTELPNKRLGRLRAGQKALQEKFFKQYDFGDWSTTILPQIITRIGKMRVTKNENGLISGQRFVKDNFITKEDKGLYVFLMLDSRGNYLSTQYRGSAREYSALVPLIPYAIRLVSGVPYTAWDSEEIDVVVNWDLAQAMLWRTDDWPTKDQLIAGRAKGLTVMSGKDEGQMRSAISSFKLYATGGTCYFGMPHLVQVMLSQIWVAHPENRTKYMVLDPLNWDRVPAPLIATNPFEPLAATEIPDSLSKISWM